jgi:hypothetical protein
VHLAQKRSKVGLRDQVLPFALTSLRAVTGWGATDHRALKGALCGGAA